MTARTALITGASSGIGAELAKLFARDGYHLIVVARRAAALQALADELTAQHGITVTVMAKDLAHAEAPAELVRELAARGLTVDVLINNAGFAAYGPFVETPIEKELAMMQLNMVALTHLTKLLLPGMVARGWGRVLNVASTAAFQPGPLMAVYYATKAYVLSFSEALANELEGSGVSVTALCPGPTESGFQERANMEESKLVQNGLMGAATVAEAGYRALMAGQTVIIPGTKNQLLAFAPRLLPRNMVTRMVRQVQDPVHS